MRIAMIGHKYIPGREGGVEVVVEELSTRMAELGHQVHAYNRYSKEKTKIKEYKGVKIITTPTIEKKSTDAVVYSFLASICVLFGKYDVIHYHALGPSVMQVIPHLFGIRTVVTVHGLNYKTPKWKGLGAKYIQLGEQITAKYANEIIVLSKEQHDYFMKKYNRETTFIPNGTTIHEICQPNEIQKKWRLEKNGYVLFVSRLVPGKGLEHLIEAYKQIDLSFPLIIAGESTFVDDFYNAICKSAAEDDRIHMIGFASGDTLRELYSNTALFVFPSEAEGMPMCLLEAMSFNAPCLVSDIPENTEVGKEYVQSFKTGDVDDLKMQLERCLQDNTTLFAGNCRSYIMKQYDWEAVVQKTLQCYRGEGKHAILNNTNSDIQS